MERYGYADLEAHRQLHRKLMDQIASVQTRFDTITEAELSSLLKDWVVNHILKDDRRFAQELNAKGVY